MATADVGRAAGLRRMKAVALGLLALAAVVFVLTHGRDGGWGYLNAAAEAAMVGAIADWFAVTALFRHPLGIPVPHTALIPHRKDELAHSLEQFVADNFLTPQTVRERYLDAGVVGRVGDWLSEPVNAERVVAEAAPALRRAVERVGETQVRELVDDTVLPRLHREQLAPAAGHLLEAVVAQRTHHGLVDLTARELHSWLEAHPEDVTRIVLTRAPGWAPRWLNDQVIGRVYAEVLAWSRDIRDDPEHEVRRALDSYLAGLGRGLQRDAATRERAERLKDRLLEHPQVASTAVALIGTLRTVLIEAIDDPRSRLRERLAAGLAELGTAMRDDDELRDRWEAWSADAVAGLVPRYGRELTSVISATIRQWDGREAADRIELHVGRDLQFIRINGTVVGALVGVMLHTVGQLL